MKQIDVSRVDLNLLTAFEVLYQERSVSAAADRIFIGQPAMSHALARLRRLFDDKLLERHGQKMQPTRRAQALYPVVHQILTDVREKVLEQTAFTPQTLDATLRIGLSDYSELVFARPLFQKLTTEAPDIKVSFFTVNQSNAYELLKNGKLDMALGHWPNPPSEVAVSDLYMEKHVCLFDSKLVDCDLPISLADYVATPHALVSLDGVLKTGVDELLAQKRLKRNAVLGCSRFTALLDMLKGQRLISVVPELLTRLEAASDMTFTEPPIPVADFTIGLVWRKSDGNAPLLDWLRALIADLVITERNKKYS